MTPLPPPTEIEDEGLLDTFISYDQTGKGVSNTSAVPLESIPSSVSDIFSFYALIESY